MFFFAAKSTPVVHFKNIEQSEIAPGPEYSGLR